MNARVGVSKFLLHALEEFDAAQWAKCPVIPECRGPVNEMAMLSLTLDNAAIKSSATIKRGPQYGRFDREYVWEGVRRPGDGPRV